jgi:hypothetical protein
MLRLRRGTVVEAEPLTVEVDGDRRRAWADEALVGEVLEGDEVVVNTASVELGLGSGGFDVVHLNLTRGLEGGGEAGDAHVMKLNYTSLQHPVKPVEPVTPSEPETPTEAPVARRIPVLVIPLHGHLAPAAWAACEAAEGLTIGFVQTVGGALPGSLSRDVADLSERRLLAGHVTAGAAYGGRDEAISVVGALHAAAERLGWDGVIVGPGPGILGSESRYGHGGMAALDAAHAALALGLPTLLSPRLSSGDERPRHRGLSHHTESVLHLLLAPVRVPVPEVAAGDWPTGEIGAEEAAAAPLDSLREACADRHDLLVQPVDLAGYRQSGLPIQTMGRQLEDDALFFAAPLAAGRALAQEARAA